MTSVFELFQRTWQKFQQWVSDNRGMIRNPELQETVLKGLQRKPELAFIVMCEKVIEHAEIIETRDLARALQILPPSIRQQDLVLTEEIVEKAFRFAEVFLALARDQSQ